MADSEVEVISLRGAPVDLGQSEEHDEPLSGDIREPQEMQEVQPQATPIAEEDADERRKLLRRIKNYTTFFPEELSDVDVTQAQFLGIEPLRVLAEDVAHMVGTRRSAAQARTMYVGGLQLSERAGPHVGLDLTGLASMAASSEELLRTVDEVGVKYANELYIDPLIRLGMATMQLALAVDNLNQQKAPQLPATPPAVQTPPTQRETEIKETRPDNIATEEFKDL
jgi:hypothetical protein